jgi:hypothetical protein
MGVSTGRTNGQRRGRKWFESHGYYLCSRQELLYKLPAQSTRRSSDDKDGIGVVVARPSRGRRCRRVVNTAGRCYINVGKDGSTVCSRWLWWFKVDHGRTSGRE